MSTSIKRVTSIPLVSDSLASVHEVLLSNGLTRSPYSLSLALGEKALNLSEPLQIRLAPVINRADGLANKGLDAVQSRYPYAFETPSQDIYRDIKSYPDHAVGVARETANNVALDIDQRLTPLVNSYETVISRISSRSSAPRSPSETDSDATQDSMNTTAQSQVERAYRLTLDLRNQVYSLSSEQLSHHQTLAAVVQKVTQTVYDVNTQIANSYLNVKGKGVQLKDATQHQVHQVGHNIHHQLDRIQEATKSLPAHIQSSLSPVTTHLSETLHSLSAVLKSDAPIGDKAAQLRQTVRAEVQPLLDTTLDFIHAYSESTRKFVGLKVAEVEEKVDEEGRKFRETSKGDGESDGDPDAGRGITPSSSAIFENFRTVTEATWKLFGLKVEEAEESASGSEDGFLEQKEKQKEERQMQKERIHGTDGSVVTVQDLREDQAGSKALSSSNGSAKSHKNGGGGKKKKFEKAVRKTVIDGDA